MRAAEPVSSSASASPLAPSAWPALLDRPLRLAGTALSFTLFGLGALSLALFVFPACRLWPGSERVRALRVQRVIHHAYRFFVAWMSGWGLIRVRWSGEPWLRIEGPKLVVANHPTLIDVVCLVAKLPQADCIVGEAWARNPFLGLAARMAGYPQNAHGADVVADCVARLREGRTVLVFPEGTRSPQHGLHPFHRGAAHVALRAGCPVVPVTITCEPSTLRKGQPWWDVPERTVQLGFSVAKPLDPRALAQDAPTPSIAARRVSARLRSHFVERLPRARTS